MSLTDSQRMLLATGPTTEAQVLAMVANERQLAAAAAPPPPSQAHAAAAGAPRDQHALFRSLYPTFDATLARCGGHSDLALSLLYGTISAKDVDDELVVRDGPRSPPPPPAHPNSVAAAPPPRAAPNPDVAAPPPLAPAVDPNCPGLQMARDNGDARELDVVSMSPEHLWHLFMNPSVNGGYLGKSVIQVWVQGL